MNDEGCLSNLSEPEPPRYHIREGVAVLFFIDALEEIHVYGISVHIVEGDDEVGR